MSKIHTGTLRNRIDRQQSFLKRLSDFLEEHKTERYRPTRMLILGHGIAAVEDGADECDIYFLTSMWVPQNPRAWGDSICPLNLEEKGMGFIPGNGSTDRLRRVENALAFAKVVLKPANTGWYDMWENSHEIQLC